MNELRALCWKTSSPMRAACYRSIVATHHASSWSYIIRGRGGVAASVHGKYYGTGHTITKSTNQQAFFSSHPASSTNGDDPTPKVGVFRDVPSIEISLSQSRSKGHISVHRAKKRPRFLAHTKSSHWGDYMAGLLDGAALQTHGKTLRLALHPRNASFAGFLQQHMGHGQVTTSSKGGVCYSCQTTQGLAQIYGLVQQRLQCEETQATLHQFLATHHPDVLLAAQKEQDDDKRLRQLPPHPNYQGGDGFYKRHTTYWLTGLLDACGEFRVRYNDQQETWTCTIELVLPSTKEPLLHWVQHHMGGRLLSHEETISTMYQSETLTQASHWVRQLDACPPLTDKNMQDYARWRRCFLVIAPTATPTSKQHQKLHTAVELMDRLRTKYNDK
jgi:hypothetical protein